MFKLILIGTLLGLVVGQFNPQNYMMMQMMQNMAGSNSGASSSNNGQSNSGGGGNEMNNVLLCRNTANIAYIPCGRTNQVCDMVSYRSYQMPNLLRCSALGVGCCFKDMQAMMMARNFAGT